MSVRDELFTLQLEQLKHDEKYHRDIHVLPLHQRMNHMALHFAKYSGRIAEYLKSNDVRSMNKTMMDTFLMSLVTANILNIRLADHMRFAQDERIETLIDLASALAADADYIYRDRGWLLEAFAIPSGRLAKACETLDHVEGYPYRDEFVRNTSENVRTVLSVIDCS